MCNGEAAAAPGGADLCEGLRPALGGELGVAELAVAGVGGGEPLLQAALVHLAQGARAVAGGQQGLAARPLVADATHPQVTAAAGNRVKSQDVLFDRRATRTERMKGMLYAVIYIYIYINN